MIANAAVGTATAVDVYEAFEAGTAAAVEESFILPTEVYFNQPLFDLPLAAPDDWAGRVDFKQEVIYLSRVLNAYRTVRQLDWPGIAPFPAHGAVWPRRRLDTRLVELAEEAKQIGFAGVIIALLFFYIIGMGLVRPEQLRRDLGLALAAARAARVPLVIGSAAMAGAGSSRALSVVIKIRSAIRAAAT